MDLLRLADSQSVCLGFELHLGSRPESTYSDSFRLIPLVPPPLPTGGGDGDLHLSAAIYTPFRSIRHRLRPADGEARTLM
jgi:hypothetical protein